MIHKSVGRAALMQGLYYMALASGVNYFTLYYKGLLIDSQGNAHYDMIGLILLAQSLVAFMAPLIAGYIADKFQITNRLITLCSFLVALGAGLILLPGLGVFAGMSLSGKLMLIFPGAVINNFFIRPLVPLIDTGTLKALEESQGHDNNYGRVRIAGSICWILTCIIIGRWLDFSGRLTDAIMAYVVCFVILGLVAAGGFKTSVQRVDNLHWDYLLKDKTLRVIVILSFLRMFGFGMAFIYTGVFLSELNMNYTQMGLAFGLAAILEVPFFFWGDWFLIRFGSKKLIMADLTLQIVRFGIFALLPNIESAAFYVAVQTLMGLGVFLHVTGVIPLLNKIAPVHLKASYQNIYSVALAVSGIFNGLVASLIVQRLGTGVLMGVCAMIMLIGLIYSAIMLKLPAQYGGREKRRS
jgi:MFS family permease